MAFGQCIFCPESSADRFGPKGDCLFWKGGDAVSWFGFHSDECEAIRPRLLTMHPFHFSRRMTECEFVFSFLPLDAICFVPDPDACLVCWTRPRARAYQALLLHSPSLSHLSVDGAAESGSSVYRFVLLDVTCLVTLPLTCTIVRWCCLRECFLCLCRFHHDLPLPFRTLARAKSACLPAMVGHGRSDRARAHVPGYCFDLTCSAYALRVV